LLGTGPRLNRDRATVGTLARQCFLDIGQLPPQQNGQRQGNGACNGQGPKQGLSPCGSGDLWGHGGSHGVSEGYSRRWLRVHTGDSIDLCFDPRTAIKGFMLFTSKICFQAHAKPPQALPCKPTPHPTRRHAKRSQCAGGWPKHGRAPTFAGASSHANGPRPESC